MKIKWGRVDNWLAKAFAFLLIIGGIWWMAFSVRWHYHTKATDWEYLPFVVSSLFIVFGLAILSSSVTAKATAIVLPLVEQLRLGRRSTDSFAVVTSPATPAAVVPVKPNPPPHPDGSAAPSSAGGNEQVDVG